MHIVYVIAPGGGPDAYVKTLAPWLIQQGHEVSVIYTGTQRFDPHFPVDIKFFFAKVGQGHYYLSKFVGNYRLWAQRYRAIETSLEVERILLQIDRNHPVDVVELMEGYRSHRISRRFPVVVRAHGSAWAFRNFCRDGDSKWDHILVDEQANQFHQAHVVSPLSKHYADYLSTACEIHRSVFQELPYPVDLDRFSPVGDRIVDAAPIALMSIGRLEHRKGSDVTVLAMNTLWGNFPEARLYLLGSASQFTKSHLQGLAEIGHRQKIIFPGFVSNLLVPAYYRAMKIYLALTQYETFGYTILEALACGVPVISCPVGAVAELVQIGVNGLLVPFGDACLAAQAISDLLQDDPLRRRMGRNAQETASAYSLNKIGPKHIQMYTEAMDVFASK